jgi:hypothetical protein
LEGALASYRKAAELEPTTAAYKVKVDYAESELAKSRAASPLADLGSAVPPTAGAGVSATGGMPAVGAGGMPDLAGLAQNPAIMNMMQNMFGSQMDMSQLGAVLRDPSTMAAAYVSLLCCPLCPSVPAAGDVLLSV